MMISDKAKTFFADTSARGAAKKTLSLLMLAFCLCCVKLCAEDTSPAEAQLMREKFVAESKKHVGAPYVLGAVGPDNFDCSGLVYYCSRESLKKQLPRTAKAIYFLFHTLFDLVYFLYHLLVLFLLIHQGDNLNYSNIQE